MIAFYRQKRLTVAASIVNNPFSAFSLASHYHTPNLVDLTSSVREKKLTQSEKQQSLFYIFHWLLEWFNKKKKNYDDNHNNTNSHNYLSDAIIPLSSQNILPISMGELD